MYDLVRRRASRFLAVFGASAVAASLGVPLAAPAAAVETTPTVQVVVSRVRFVSVVGTPQVGDAVGIAIHTGVAAQQPVDNVRDDGEEGSSRVPLTRKYPRFDYEDANFIHNAQFGFASNTFQWSTRMTSQWQAAARSPVAESTYWYVNGGKAQGSGHVQAPNYTFHGSFAARPGDTIDMATELTFECFVNGQEATCSGTLYSQYYIVP